MKQERLVEDIQKYAQNIVDTVREPAPCKGGAYSPQALGERVVEVVKQFAAGCNQHDDIA